MYYRLDGGSNDGKEGSDLRRAQKGNGSMPKRPTCPVLDLGYNLQLLGDNIPKYIRIGSAQRDFRRLYVRKMMMKITLRQR